MNTKQRITLIFRDLGVPAHLVGYELLRDAVELAVADKNTLLNGIRDIYVPVAEKHGTTKVRLERQCRHTIFCAWERTEGEAFKKYFGNASNYRYGRPTIMEFIATIANHILTFEGE